MSIGRITGKGAAEQLIGIEEMLRKQAEKQLEQAENGGRAQTETRSVLEAVKAADTGVVGGLFVGGRIDPETSRYVEASLQSMDVLKDQKRAMSAQVWANSDRLGGLQGKSREYVERERLREELNKSNDEIRDDIERKAQEAQAPKDAEGNPIPGAAVGTEAEVPKVAEAPTPAPEANAAVPADGASAAAPQVSINIRV